MINKFQPAAVIVSEEEEEEEKQKDVEEEHKDPVPAKSSGILKNAVFNCINEDSEDDATVTPTIASVYILA
jgi:hypothetical protein